MTAIRRRRLIWTGVRTVLLTLVVLAMVGSELLGRIERFFYDMRAYRCQVFAPPPTKQLVHLDIDETALNEIGRWPWKRELPAEILDEVRLAEPKVLATDLLFSEPAGPGENEQGKKIDPDAILAESLHRFGKALLPASLAFRAPGLINPLDQHLSALLTADPELTAEQCIAQLEAAGFKATTLAGEVGRRFNEARSHAMCERIHAEMERGLSDATQIKRKMLPHLDPRFYGGLLDRLFDEQYARARCENGVMRFTLPRPAGLPPIIAASEAALPIERLSTASRYGAFVDYLPEGVDGTVRSVPLLAEYRGRLLPHMSIATVCAMLDVDPQTLRLTADSITIPRPGGGDIVIPVSTKQTFQGGHVGMILDVPMFGRKDSWETMYDYPQHREPAQHISIYDAWSICQTRTRISRNENTAEAVLRSASAAVNVSVPADDELAHLRGPELRQLIDDTIANMTEVKKGLASIAATDLGDKEKALVQNLGTFIAQLTEINRQNDLLAVQLKQLRGKLHDALSGKAVFLGGIATGDMDMHSTSLHYRCPGVVIQGAVFSSILTGRMWRVAPAWSTYLIIAAMGLLTGLVCSLLPPRRAFIATALLIFGYFAVNGYLLFDYGQLIVATGGPVLAAGLVWSGLTLTNFITEVAERGRITRRFSSYVDPSLVNWVIEHPEQVRFTGELREMTMGFTDLERFTTLTENLGERAVPLLAEYMEHMIPAIRAHGGFVSRLMGDGIFFFNAPAPDPDHAVHSVSTMLTMHRLVDEMNLTLPKRDYPLLAIRGGLCTGRVILGDAGSREFSDYTAIGDSVNIAARLESANKIFGTRILAAARTVELLKGQFLVRPIASLRVAGKANHVAVYEPLCRMEDASSAQRRLADLSVQIVTTFQGGNFAACIEAADRLEREFGASKFSALYRIQSLQYQEALPDDFNGQIVLTEK